jgi:hypothetical protein
MSEPLRTLEFGELLDSGFSLYRHNFTVFFATALVPQLPLVVLWLALPVVAGAVGSDTVMTLTSLLVMPYSLFATLLVYSALTYAVGMAYSGHAPAVADSLGTGLRKWLPVAIATVLSYFAIMLGFILFIIPGLILLAMFFAVHPAVVLEGRGPISAMGRSRDLSRGARMRILGIVVVAWIITMLPAIAMWTVAGVSAGMGALAGELVLGTGNLWLQGLLQAAGLIISAVTAPFLILVTVLLYYDRRARTEAPDLEAAADALTRMR